MWIFDRQRTKFGQWLKQKGISQMWLAEESGVSYDTINDLSLGKRKRPTKMNAKKIIRALRDLGHDVNMYDFWM